MNQSPSGSQNKEKIDWACTSLTSLGFTLKNKNSENIQNTPWSCVIRFETSSGYIYLKQTPEPLALEARIIKILHEKFDANVPEIIAYNAQLDCFLMKDAGKSLRETLKQKFDAALIFKTIDQFTSLQVKAAENISVLTSVGVPDWRLDKMPDLLMQLFFQKKLLIEDGLTEKEIDELKKYHSAMSALCKKLSDYLIPETIVQPDFNDNNTLIDEFQKITLIDVGEIVISHPFFSLCNFLYQMEKQYGLTAKDDIYLKIKNAYFKNYLQYDPKENLTDAFDLAQTLWCAYSALANHRLMIACGSEKLMAWQPGKLSRVLKSFMASLTD